MEEAQRLYVSAGKSEKEFLMCERCRAVIPIGNFSNHIHEAPEFIYNQQTGEIIELPKNDLADFLAAHKDHRFNYLNIIDGPLSRQPFNEPVGVTYYNVEIGTGNGTRGERLVLKRFRDDINAPYQYQFLKGHIKIWVSDIKPKLENIERQLKKEKEDINEFSLYYFIFGIDAILGMEFKHICDELAGGLEPLLDQGAAAITDHPLIINLRMNDWFVNNLEYLVNAVIAKADKPFLLNFIELENNPHGLLALRVTLDFSPPNHKKEREK